MIYLHFHPPPPLTENNHNFTQVNCETDDMVVAC